MPPNTAISPSFQIGSVAFSVPVCAIASTISAGLRSCDMITPASQIRMTCSYTRKHCGKSVKKCRYDNYINWRLIWINF